MVDCGVCENRGWWLRDDGGNKTAVRCACQKPDAGGLLRRAGVPPKYRTFTRATYSAAWPPEFAEWPAGESWVLTILGLVGVGKTHLGTALFAERLEAGARGRWCDVGELLEDLRALDYEAAGDALLRLRQVPLLMLDDLTARYKTAFAESQISGLLRARDARQLPTILTASVSLVDIGLDDPALASRLGAQLVIELTGADRRLEE